MKNKAVSSPSPADANEAEGGVTAARRYSQGLRRSISAGSTLALAQRAKRALEGPEAKELLRAERAAKAGKSEAPPKRQTPGGGGGP
jgi:hypothetical protein